MCPKSGYKTITGIQFVNAISLLQRKEISFRAFRVYLACFSAVAIREAATRLRRKNGKEDSVVPSYRISELGRAVSASERQVRAELRSLRKKQLLSFGSAEISVEVHELPGTEALSRLLRTPGRPVPVPRATLRFLASERKKSVALTAIAYMLRGLTIGKRGGAVTGKGSVKLSWVAALTGLSERAAAYARAELIRVGWISSDSGSTQWKLNRHGAYFEINLDYHSKGPAAASMACESKEGTKVEFAAQVPESGAHFAPPYKDKKTSSNEESKNQKTQSPEPAGVSKKEKGKTSFCDVKPENLRNFSDMEALYFDACARGLVRPAEATALDFLAAAIKARSVEEGDPVRIFVALVRRALWQHITQADEDAARKTLLRFRERDPGRFRYTRIAA